MNKVRHWVPSPIAVDRAFRTLGLYASLWPPLLFLVLGLLFLDGVPQARELLRSLLAEDASGRTHQALFMLVALVAWLAVVRWSARNLLHSAMSRERQDAPASIAVPIAQSSVVMEALVALAAAYLAWVLWAASAHGAQFTTALAAVPGLYAAHVLFQVVRRTRQHTTPAVPIPTAAAASTHRRSVLIAAAGFATLGSAYGLSPGPTGDALGSMATLFTGLSLWLFFVTFFWSAVLERRRGAMATLAVLLLATWIGSVRYDLRAGLVAADRTDPRPRMDTHYAAWKKTLPNPDNSPIFVVAASGGGLRAAVWTGLLLAQFDDATCGEFSRHVFAYSGVSGGSVGIAAFLAQKNAATPADRCAAWRTAALVRMLDRDFLAPVAGSVLFSEPLQRLVPVDKLFADRGSVLADAWRSAWDSTHASAPGYFGAPFLQVFDAQRTDAVQPAVFLNATRVESGRRVVASNVRLPLPEIDDLLGSSGLQGDTRLQVGGLSLADAVLNSARFTYVSPAANVWGCFRRADPQTGEAQAIGDECGDPRLRKTMWGRLVDGGYFENSGLATLTDVMRELGVKDRKLASYAGNPVYYIVITNSQSAVQACPGRITPRWNLREQGGREAAMSYEVITLVSRMLSRPSQPVDAAPTFSQLFAPVETMLSVRDARANVEVSRLQLAMGCQNILEWSLFSDAITSAEKAAQAHPEPALGWFLSSGSLDFMQRRAALYVEHFPFDLASCDRPKRQARDRIGDPAVVPPTCRPAHLPAAR